MVDFCWPMPVFEFPFPLINLIYELIEWTRVPT